MYPTSHAYALVTGAGKGLEKPLPQNWPNEKPLRELGINYRSIDQAILDAADHFTYSNNYSQIKNT